VARTSGFHPGNRGSIPLWTTNFLIIYTAMANHKSSKKRIRQTETKNEGNKYYAKTMRNALKDIRSTTSKKEAEELLPKMNSMIDRLAKKKIIHSKKASNLKSSVDKHVNSLK
jgi:small subunit ribosomal protein S20